MVGLLRDHDLIREKEIIQLLKCKFIRIHGYNSTLRYEQI